ncbi:MAG: tetraacyldisaccharide 4'-kinase, partial [Prevotellaceae bacterium]|nr:tetraacyldisaccharide 4'-kinase [Prevotellaceae bacterium]
MEPNPKYLPLSWGYGLAVFLRNELFDLGILKSQEFDIPIIGVGNITVGGTGKTPCVEYLIRLLKDDCKVAVLSRGYKRKTKGYVLANDNTPATDIGDEAFQIKQKFPEVIVAVDEKRVDGIKHLLQLNPKPDVVILDDCYQHRYVKPGINILLMDYNNMPDKDKLLPAGRLREPVSSRIRADIIIVTKCPADLKPIDFRVLTKEVGVYPYQRVYFSSIQYQALRKMEPSTINHQPS